MSQKRKSGVTLPQKTIGKKMILTASLEHMDAITIIQDLDLVKGVFGDDLANLDISEDAIENNLIDYFEENMVEASGLHLQAGLRFKVLMLDTHLNARYNLAKDVYADKPGFLQVMFKTGFAI